MTKGTHCFPKSEHLKSKNIIENLYAKGSSVTVFPLRAVFISQAQELNYPTSSVLINVAKRRFRHAVDRNLIKRRIREAYRLNKAPFVDKLEQRNTKLAIAILYIDNKPSSTNFLKHKMEKLLTNILEKEQKQCENY